MLRLLLCCLMLLPVAATAADTPPAVPAAGPVAAPPAQPAASARTAPEGIAAAVVAGSAAMPAMVQSDDAWLDRGVRLPRLAANLIRDKPLSRPIGIDYRIRPGDLLRVVTWGGISRNDQVPVDAAGNLALPGVGMLPVGGLAVGEAQARSLELLRTQFRDAGAIIAVETAGNAGVTVTGEVAAPGYMPLPPGGTVLEALAAAGGVLDQGSLRNVVVRRPGADKVETVDLYLIALDGDTRGVMALPPGSAVHVPLAGPQVQVHGAVRRPARIELLPGQDLAQALAYAGGPDAAADPETIRLLRESSTGQVVAAVHQADLGQVAARDGDRLLVASRLAARVGTGVITVDGLVRSPGTHAWREGLTVGDALTATGGVLPGGDTTQLIIERTLTTPRLIDLGGGISGKVFKELVADVHPTTVLQALDRLVVPAVPSLADQRATVAVQGAVRSPAKLPYTEGMTMNDAIKLAGGVLPEAQIDLADLVRVVIGADGERDVERLSIELKPILDGAPGLRLRNQDTLVIRTRPDDRVRLVVSGEVRSTGEFVLPRGTTLRHALEIAGGLTADAFAQGARFYRESEAREAQRQLEDMVRQLNQALSVNQQQLATANTPAGQKILQATIANQESELARMQRASATGRMAGIDLARLMAGDAAADLILQPGDRIEVPTRPGTIRVLGEVMVPGSLRQEPGMRAPEAIRRSGGTTAQADLDRVFVVRADGSVVASAAFTGTAWDSGARRWVRTDLRRMELLEGDSVIVPPDLQYHRDGLELAKDWSQVLFQVATAAGTVAVLSK